MTYAEGFERGSQPAPVGNWYTEPQQAQPFDTRKVLRRKLEQTGAALLGANSALRAARQSALRHEEDIRRLRDRARERDVTHSEAMQKMREELRECELHNEETIRQLHEELRSGDREALARQQQQSIRLELVKQFWSLDLHDVDRMTNYVINGIVPPVATVGKLDTPDFDKTVTEPEEEQLDPVAAPRVRRDELLDTYAELELVSQKISALRRDSQVSVGKVRIQNIDDRVKAVLHDLYRIMEDAQ